MKPIQKSMKEEATKSEEAGKGYITAEKLAKLLDLSVRRVQALRADGAFVRGLRKSSCPYCVAKFTRPNMFALS